MLWWTIWIAVVACLLGLLWKKDEGYMLVQWHPIENCPASSSTSSSTTTKDSSFRRSLVQVSSPWHVVGKPNEKDEGRRNHNNATAATTTTMMDVDVCEVFSETYWEARRKFRQAVRQLQVQEEQQQQHGSNTATTTTTTTITSKPLLPNVALYRRVIVPAATATATTTAGQVDPDDDPDYTMDIAVIPGNVPGWVIHTSGTHGVEGYAGSAIQIATLQLLVRQLSESSSSSSSSFSSSSSPRPTLVLVHAVNPYGMAHDRRVNEHNVDLNRNGLTPALWQTYALPPPPHPPHFNRDTYNIMDHRLFRLSTGAPKLWWSAMEFFAKGMVALIRYGHGTIKGAMVGGQYHVPDGIFYGGNGKAEPSLHELQLWLQDEFLPQHAKATTRVESSRTDVPENAEKTVTTTTTTTTNAVTWIDVHTGLGPFGVDTLMLKPEMGEVAADDLKAKMQDESNRQKVALEDIFWKHFQALADELDHWFPGSHHPFRNKAALQVAQGYENVRGFLQDYFSPVFAVEQQKSLLVMAQEFGTITTLWVGLALVLENAAYHHLPPAAAQQWAHYTTRRAFDPHHFGWRHQVLSRGLTLLQQAMERSMQLSTTATTTTTTAFESSSSTITTVSESASASSVSPEQEQFSPNTDERVSDTVSSS